MLAASTAAITLITVAITLVTAAITLVVSLRSKGKIDHVQVLVNDRMTQMTNRVDQLVEALTEAGVTVPLHVQVQTPKEREHVDQLIIELAKTLEKQNGDTQIVSPEQRQHEREVRSRDEAT